MGIAQIPIPTAASGLTVGRFPAAIGNPFQIPAGLTLQHTVTTTTTFTAGQLPAQVFAVIVGGGGGGAWGGGGENGGGGGGACIGWVDVPSSGITATIGAGGAGGSSNTTGTRGGSTVFGSYVAFGGGGGNSGVLFNNHNQIPLGDGAGYGGVASPQPGDTNRWLFGPKGSPFTQGIQVNSGGSISSLFITTNNLGIYNYNGGGGGGSTIFSSFLGSNGLPGLTGGGGRVGASGGGSSRDGGVSITFAGGSATSGSGGGGGGAGLLGAGSNGSTGGGGNGGSGGGGGGSGPNANSNPGGNGGNGCVLIYF